MKQQGFAYDDLLHVAAVGVTALLSIGMAVVVALGEPLDRSGTQVRMAQSVKVERKTAEAMGKAEAHRQGTLVAAKKP